MDTKLDTLKKLAEIDPEIFNLAVLYTSYINNPIKSEEKDYTNKTINSDLYVSLLTLIKTIEELNINIDEKKIYLEATQKVATIFEPGLSTDIEERICGEFNSNVEFLNNLVRSPEIKKDYIQSDILSWISNPYSWIYDGHDDIDISSDYIICTENILKFILRAFTCDGRCYYINAYRTIKMTKSLMNDLEKIRSDKEFALWFIKYAIEHEELYDKIVSDYKKLYINNI